MDEVRCSSVFEILSSDELICLRPDWRSGMEGCRTVGIDQDAPKSAKNASIIRKNEQIFFIMHRAGL